MEHQETAPVPGVDPAPAERRPGFVRGLYRDEWAMWKAHYRRYFIIAARVLALGFVLGFVYFLLWPAQEKRALIFVMKQLKDIPLGAPPLILALVLFFHNARASALAVAAGIVPLACLPVLDPLLNGAVIGLLASLAKHQGLNVPLLLLKGVAPHGIFELAAVLYATSTGMYLSTALAEQIRAGLARKRGDARPDAEAAAVPEGPAESPPPFGPGESGTDSGGAAAVNPSGQENGKGADGTAEIGLKRKPPLVCCLASVARSFLLVVLPLLAVAAFIEAFITLHL